MTVRPQVRMGGTSLLVPMKLTGPIRSPVVAVDRLGAAESNAGTVAGAVIGGATPLGLSRWPFRRGQAAGWQSR